MSKELARIGDIIDIQADPRDDQIDDLQRQVTRLRGELSDARHDLARVKDDSNRALTALRQQLSPLYRALQRVFGELDDAGVPDVPVASTAAAGAAAAPSAVDSRLKAIWDNWKTNLPGYPARVIDALLLHADMNTSQLAIACGCKPQRISEAIVKLNKAGLINKNGGRFALKQL